MQVIEPKTAREYVLANYPNDPLLKHIALSLLEQLPKAEIQEVAQGVWKGEADGYADGLLIYDVWHCSECNYCIDGEDDPEYLPNYCPKCGAKMDGGAAGG